MDKVAAVNKFKYYFKKLVNISESQGKTYLFINDGKLTFSADSVEAISGDGCAAVIRYGQVIKGAATTPRGQKADSIIAYVFYNDGYDLTYKFSGFRYTGYSADME